MKFTLYGYQLQQWKADYQASLIIHMALRIWFSLHANSAALGWHTCHPFQQLKEKKNITMIFIILLAQIKKLAP